MAIAKIDPKYTTTATVTGGRNGHGETDNEELNVDLAMPKELGGKGGATNPEDLFAVGYGACFQGALGLAGKEMDVDTEDSVVTCTIGIGPEGESFGLNAAITVALEGQELETVQELADRAHELCPYSKATRGNIEVTVEAVEA